MRKKLCLILVLVMLIIFMSMGVIGAEANQSMNVGDYIKFGSYNDAPMLWRVINIDEDGDPMLNSEKIIAMKPFDSAGGTNPYTGQDKDRENHGSNNWEYSNIRQWLNSDNQKIEWLQNPPTTANVYSGIHAYADKEGFLADGNFTSDERKLLKPVKHKFLLAAVDEYLKDGGSGDHIWESTIENIFQNYDDARYKMVTDKIFLLSVKELKEYINDRGWDHIKMPTPEAVANSEFSLLANIDKPVFRQWLRTPDLSINEPTKSSSAVRSVGGMLDFDATEYLSNGLDIKGLMEMYENPNTHDYIFGANANMGSGGIVPACYLYMDRINNITGSGTIHDPYIIVAATPPAQDEDKDSEPAPDTPATGINETINIKLSIGQQEAVVNGEVQLVDANPFVKPGVNRTLVPLRFIGEALGVKVTWVNEEQKVILEDSDLEIVLIIDSDKALVNGREVILDCPAEILPPGRTFVPLRFVSENMGALVEYVHETQEITITK